MDQKNGGVSSAFKTEIPQIMRFWQVVQSGEPQARLPWGLTPIE